MRRWIALTGCAALLLSSGRPWLALFPALPGDLGGVESLDPQARRARIPTADGDTVDGWFLRGRGDAAVLLLHGHGRTHERVWRCGRFSYQAGYSLLAIDFRLSRPWDRKPTTLGSYEVPDARGALAWLTQQPGFDRRGERCGGLPEVATRRGWSPRPATIKAGRGAECSTRLG
ncbi:MAG TPA: hypothetical protein VGK93_07990 [Candidatus Eisenbacteria bacterium]